MSGIKWWGRTKHKESLAKPTDGDWREMLSRITGSMVRNIKNVTTSSMRQVVREPFWPNAVWAEDGQVRKEEMADKKCALLASSVPDRRPEVGEIRNYAYLILDSIAALKVVTFRLERLPFDQTIPGGESYIVRSFAMRKVSYEDALFECHCTYKDIFLSLYRIRSLSTDRRHRLLAEAAADERKILLMAEDLFDRGIEFPGNWYSPQGVKERIKKLEKMVGHYEDLLDT